MSRPLIGQHGTVETKKAWNQMSNFTSPLRRVAALLFSTSLALGAVTACGGGDNNAQSADHNVGSSFPGSEDAIDATIDTSQVKKNIVVRVDNSHYIFHNDLIVAQEKGYFKEVGIDSVDIKTLDEPIPALLGGSLDFANCDSDSVLGVAHQSNSDLRFLAVTFGGEFVGLGVRQGISNASELKGKILSGGEFNTRNDANLRELLRANGVNPDSDVKIVATGGGPNERLKAILSGTIDGGNVQLRHRQALEDAGGTILFETLQQTPQSGWAAARIPEQSPETAAAFLTAVLRARAYIDDPTNKDEVITLMREKGFVITPEYAAAYDEENAPDYHTVDGGFEPQDMSDLIEDSITFGTAPEGTDWTQYTYLLPLWRAQKANGLPLRPSPDSLPAAS